MELQVRKDYDLDNLGKDWGFEIVLSPQCGAMDYYRKYDCDRSSYIQVWQDRDVIVSGKCVDDEILCLLYDLIKENIIIKA